MTFTIKPSQPSTFNDLLIQNGFSANLIYYIVYENNIPKYKIIEDPVTFILPDEICDITPIDGPIDIVFEDEYILIINKPTNLYSIPTKYKSDNLASRIVSYYNKINLHSTIHLVSRLDKNTNGLLIVAKHQHIHYLFSKVKINKIYQAMVSGKINSSGIINEKIYHIPHNVQRVIDEKGKEAITEYKVLQEYEDKTLLEIHLLTGRTHQIRTHFAYIQHPLIGDEIYGGPKGDFYLKSYHLDFIHPITNKIISITLD